MNHPFCLLMLISLCGGPFNPDGDGRSAKEDSKKIEGTWTPVAAELGGKKFSDEVLKSMKLVMADGNYTVTVGDQTDEGTVKLDPAKEPRAMDILGTKGPNRGKTIPAIYKLTDTTLRICYDLSGKARPTEFKSKADTQLFLVEYERRKP